MRLRVCLRVLGLHRLSLGYDSVLCLHICAGGHVERALMALSVYCSPELSPSSLPNEMMPRPNFLFIFMLPVCPRPVRLTLSRIMALAHDTGGGDGERASP